MYVCMYMCMVVHVCMHYVCMQVYMYVCNYENRNNMVYQQHALIPFRKFKILL